MDSIDGDFEEIADGSVVSFGAFIVEIVLLTFFAFIVSSYAGAETYGIISVLKRLLGIVIGLFGGIMITTQRTVPRYATEKQSSIFSLSFFVSIGLAVLLASLVVVFVPLIISKTIIPEKRLLYLFSVCIFFAGVLITATNNFKSLRFIRATHGLEKVLRPLLLVLITATVVFYGSKTVFGVWLGVVLSFGMTGVFSFLYLVRKTEYSPLVFSWNEATRDFLSYLVPSFLSSVVVQFQFSSYIIFMAVFLTPVEAGAFGIGLILTSFIRWPLSSVNHIFPPIATKLYNSGKLSKLDKLYEYTTRIVLIFSIPIVCVVTVYSSELLRIFSIEYAKYSLVIPLIVVGRTVANSAGSVGLLIMMTDNERINAVVQTILGVITLTFTYLATTTYGIYGIASAYSFAFVLNNIVEVIFLYKLRGIQPFTKSHVFILATGGGLLSVLLWLKTVIILYVHFLILIIFIPMYLYIMYSIVLSTDEQTVIRKLILPL